MDIQVKRIHESASDKDGKRILVDRLWPRGINKNEADLALWARDVAPSNELRKWFHEDIEWRWEEFQRRYRAEIEHNGPALEALASAVNAGPATLLVGSKDVDRNQAVVLKAVLSERAGGKPC